jgi:hypothetical protein
MSFLFCNESESVSDLFFEYCVARIIWENVSEVCGRVLGIDFESVCQIKASNVCTTGTLRVI